MEKFTNPLENIKIASPCAADWNEMVGNERQRFCGACKLNVYNLSGMSQREAENLILQAEGNRLCVRFYRRADGTILTGDCPVGWQAIKRNISKKATASASLVLAALGGIGLTNYFGKLNERHSMGTVSRVETSEKNVTAVKEINSNTAVRFEPVAAMGQVVREDSQVVGMMVNRTTTKSEIKKQRKR